MNSEKTQINSKFWTYFLLGYLFWLTSIFFGRFEANSASWSSIQAFLLRGLLIFILLVPLRYIYRYFSKKIKSFAVLILLSILTSFVFGTLNLLIRELFSYYIIPINENWLPINDVLTLIQIVLVSGLWIFFYFSILFLIINYWQELESEKERSKNAIILAQKAQLQMLRYQLNPHFLFNSLTSIQALVHENPERADLMVTELSDFLRFTLLYNDQITITVREEINITEKYLEIEKIRFEERLDYSIKYDNAVLNTEIPCFITQPLVENAVKFGLQNSPQGIKVRMNFSQSDDILLIEVSNTGKLSDGWSMGIGLQNITERLYNAYPGDYKFDLNEAEGCVLSRILIRKKIET